MARERDVLRLVAERLGTPDPDRVRLGPGDDAAILADGTVITTDTIVDGVHVDRRWSTLEDIGWKAVHAAVSDIPAMGAHPTGAVIATQLPSDWSTKDAAALLDGLVAGAAAAETPIVGGDVTTGPVLAVTVTVTGRLLAEPCLRSGAGPGEVVALIGDLGRAASGLALHRAAADGDAAAAQVLASHPELSEAHRRPKALVAAAPVLADPGVTAAIDISDGLGRDLGHIAEASGVAIELSSVPMDGSVEQAVAALDVSDRGLLVGGGDDHALVITIQPVETGRIAMEVAKLGLAFVVIGSVRDGSGVTLAGEDVSEAGWEHQ